MAMMGGLDCIAMAVEHLERSEHSVSSSTASVELPVSRAPPSVLVPASSGGPTHKAFEVNSTDSHLQLPSQSSFMDQPRVVSVSEVDNTSIADAVGKSDMMIDPRDANRIEELRQLIFQIDLAEWKTMSQPDMKEIITTVTHTDVLSGRGGETNHHKGNITFRACVRACQAAYIDAKRRDKPYIAQRIVIFIRKLGGRFLKKDRDSSIDVWKDVGNNKAREKTSQALREGAPELRGDVKEGVSTSATEPSLVASKASSTHDPYFEYGSVPKMVTVSAAYDMGASAAPMFSPHGFVDPTHRPTKKQRHSTLYADAAGMVVACHPHPALVPMVSEDSFRVYHGYHQPHHPLPSCPPPNYPQGMAAAPGSPRVTVSADEEERSNPSSPTICNARRLMTTTTTSAGGPRLKLLKKRLQSHDSMSSTCK